MAPTCWILIVPNPALLLLIPPVRCFPAGCHCYSFDKCDDEESCAACPRRAFCGLKFLGLHVRGLTCVDLDRVS